MFPLYYYFTKVHKKVINVSKSYEHNVNCSKDRIPRMVLFPLRIVRGLCVCSRGCTGEELSVCHTFEVEHQYRGYQCHDHDYDPKSSGVADERKVDIHAE